MEEEIDPRTFKEKFLFYTTAFFVLLAIFSLFAFLFLVPFVIEPAFTTIFMQFDENPALCVTMQTEHFFSATNCSWASCREGCTREIFRCTQIRVNYKLGVNVTSNSSSIIVANNDESTQNQQIKSDNRNKPATAALVSSPMLPMSSNIRAERAIREYDEHYINLDASRSLVGDDLDSFMEYPEEMTGLMGNNSEWYFIGARVFPNVKGCGYPPFLNCTIWNKKYMKIGTNFTCYRSRVDPSLVITKLDLWMNKLKLVLAMAIPIPCFIIACIYLAFAYFVIFNEEEDTTPLDKDTEEMADDEEMCENGDVDVTTDGEDNCMSLDGQLPNGGASMTHGSKPLTPNSATDINSFGHQLKVRMVDELSRDSLDAGILSNSASIQGNLSKTMTTSISTPPGPIAAV